MALNRSEYNLKKTIQYERQTNDELKNLLKKAHFVLEHIFSSNCSPGSILSACAEVVVYVRVPAACPFTNKLVFRREILANYTHFHVRKIKISLQKPLLTWNPLSLFPWGGTLK